MENTKERKEFTDSLFYAIITSDVVIVTVVGSFLGSFLGYLFVKIIELLS